MISFTQDENSIYVDTLTQGIYTTPNYKVKNRIKKPSNEWARVQQAHEEIITHEDFTLVASLMKRDTRTAAGKDKVYLFSGMLYCADCGQNFVRKSVPRNGTTYIYHICSTYKARNKECTSHGISEPALFDAVFTSIQRHLQICLTIEETLRRIEGMPKMKSLQVILTTPIKSVTRL